jgi:L-rhamnose-H+ transport protein
MNPLIAGLGLIFFSALCNAGVGVPLRIRRRYQWENMWIVGHGFAMIILPLGVAHFVVPDWPAAIRAVGPSTIAIVMAFGFMWGIGCVTFAIGIDTIGMSLGYAIIMGIITAIGALIPMARRWSGIPTDASVVILLGIAVCIAGVAVCGKAGMVREKAVDQSAQGSSGRDASSATTSSLIKKSAAGVFAIGLAWCVLSGVFSAGNNLGFDFADRVATEAVKLGTSPVYASLARFLAVYWGGYLAVLIFCGGRMLKTGSWRNYFGAGAGRDAALSFGMGAFHFVSQVAYGAGAYYVGRLGTTVGFAVMISASIIIANLFGFVTGEWKTAVQSSIHLLYLGLVVLIIAVLILAYGNSLVHG